MRFSYLVIALLLCAVFATAYSYYYYPPYYSGQSSVERRYYYAPSSQELYFGQDYNLGTRPYGGFGSKGTLSSTPRVSGGSKGYTSPTANLATNSFMRQGRNPNVVSNSDPYFRGYNILNTAVSLTPLPVELQERENIIVLPRGTVRIISQYGHFGSGGDTDSPVSEIYLQVRDLPPIGGSNRYELWLFDAEKGNSMSLGLFYVGIGGSGQVSLEFPKSFVNYDFVAITKEPFPDADPRPDINEIIVMGAIDSSREKDMEGFVRSLR